MLKGVDRPINTVPLYSKVERLTDLQRRKRAHQRSVCRAIRRQTTDFARSGTEPAACPHGVSSEAKEASSVALSTSQSPSQRRPDRKTQ